MSLPQLKLDLSFNAKLLNDNRVEMVTELTSEDTAETFGYLLGGSEEETALSQEIVDRINKPAPNIRAIMVCIACEDGRQALKYTDAQTGNVVDVRYGGCFPSRFIPDSNLALAPAGNTFFIYSQTLRVEQYSEMTVGWPHAGDTPEAIAALLVASLPFAYPRTRSFSATP